MDYGSDGGFRKLSFNIKRRKKKKEILLEYQFNLTRNSTALNQMSVTTSVLGLWECHPAIAEQVVQA